MWVSLARAWAASFVLSFLGLVLAGGVKQAAHWTGDAPGFWLVAMIAVGGGIGAGALSRAPFTPYLPLLLTVSVPAPLTWTVLGFILRADRGYDVSPVIVLGGLVLTVLLSAGAAAGVWLLRQRLSGSAVAG